MAARKTQSARPTLYLRPNALADLAEHYEGGLGAVRSAMGIGKWPPTGWSEAAKDGKASDEVAAALDGVMHSSDVDSEYYACVLYGADPTSKSFFDALGIGRKDRAKVGGFDYPKLDVKSKKPPVQLFAALQDGLDVDDYVEAADQKAYGKAAKILERLSPLVGVELCADDNATKVVFTGSKSPSGAFVGVLAVRIET